MEQRHVGPGSQNVGAIIDNRSGLDDNAVREAIQDHWVEVSGLQFAQPSSFQLYSNYQSSMLARTPFKTPANVIDEIRLARSVADTDDDVGATLGLMIGLALGEGLQNHHKDETTLEFFNQMTGATGMDLEGTVEEMYREFLIAGQVTTLTLFTRKRMSYVPLKADEPVQAQLQVPTVGVLPAENLRVITNDVMNEGQLGYVVEDQNLKNWLDEFFSPRTPGQRKAIMAMQEPIPAALFTGRVEVPYNDGDINSRGKTIYTLNQRMIHRTSLPKGASPYPRPLLTRNFALLEAKRLLNIMDYALLQGGTNYIVVAKKGSDTLPAQPEEINNLVQQVSHASRSGVLVGDHRLNIEIITPDLEELLNPAKRKLLGRKISMGLLRQPEQVTGDSGGKGAENEMEFTARIVSSDRRKMLRHAQAAFYDDTGVRNRTVFKEGAPTIWAPKIILAGAKDFWSQVLNARDRGDIPRRWSVEALGFNYEAGLAEREREIARGDDEILTPASVPFSDPAAGPQDNGPGRPRGTSPNNGSPADGPPQGRDRFAPNHVIQRTPGETVRAIVDGTDVTYFGVTTLTLLTSVEGEPNFGYTTETDYDAIKAEVAIRHGKSITVPVNRGVTCTDYRAIKLDEGLRVIVGKRLGDDAIIARALRFTEPSYDLKATNDYLLRWGFIADAMTEATKRCKNCGNELPSYSDELPGLACPSCGTPAGGSQAGDGDADVARLREIAATWEVCPECKGAGEIEGGPMIGMMKCPLCKGIGKIPKEDEAASKKRRKDLHAAGLRFCVGCGFPVSQGTTTCTSCGMDPDGDGDVDPAGGDPPGSP